MESEQPPPPPQQQQQQHGVFFDTQDGTTIHGNDDDDDHPTNENNNKNNYTINDNNSALPNQQQQPFPRNETTEIMIHCAPLPSSQLPNHINHHDLYTTYDHDNHHHSNTDNDTIRNSTVKNHVHNCMDTNDEEDVTIISMSPEDGNIYYHPSSSEISRKQHRQKQQHPYSNDTTTTTTESHKNYTTTTTMHKNIHMIRPSRESVLQRLCEALLRRSLTKIDLSQRGLISSDARLVKMALLQNQQLSVLKLGYNNLGDDGATILSSSSSSSSNTTRNQQQHDTNTNLHTSSHYHHPLQNLVSLDLGFNNIGDVGCTALCHSISYKLHTLYLAGNLIGTDGAYAIADLIHRPNSQLRKLYLTGNLLGPDGVKAITEAIIETEQRQFSISNGSRSCSPLDDDIHHSSYTMDRTTTIPTNVNITAGTGDVSVGSIEELYLGGSGMGPIGCEYIARLLEHSRRIRVISLPNCDINDESISLIASSIKSNRDHLPLQSLQLSFNRISCKGVECLVNSIWGSTTMKELLLDNNEIADRGAQHMAAVLLPHVKTLETLNIGFNLIKSPGLQIFMKAIIDTACSIRSLSISGNMIDTLAAKAISYALAYNRTIQSLSLVHCNIGHEGQRHISAGVVSNSRSALRELSGYDLGPVVVTLGFPAAVESWSNDKILYFLSKMWNHHRGRNMSTIDNELGINEAVSPDEEEKLVDPLNFLNGPTSPRSVPEDATIVVEVANKAFAELCENDLIGFSRKKGSINQQYFNSPIVDDEIMLESSVLPIDPNRCQPSFPANKKTSFIASPEPPREYLPDPVRKKRIAEWLSSNIKEITKLSQQPFSSSDLWRLHQHYFTPVVNECGGEPIVSQSLSCERTTSSVPEVSRPGSTENPGIVNHGSSDGVVSPASQPTITNQMTSLPILKRKVSYRFLSEAATLCTKSDNRNVYPVASTPNSVSQMIDNGPLSHTMPPTTKRARRNRSRISFLPKVKSKLDSYLDVCHDKALITMRQLYYVERAILSGQVNPLEPTTNGIPHLHLSGELAHDAEMIIVDML